MPRKFMFTREEIIAAAVELVQERGMDALTAPTSGDALVGGHSICRETALLQRLYTAPLTGAGFHPELSPARFAHCPYPVRDLLSCRRRTCRRGAVPPADETAVTNHEPKNPPDAVLHPGVRVFHVFRQTISSGVGREGGGKA